MPLATAAAGRQACVAVRVAPDTYEDAQHSENGDGDAHPVEQ